MAPLRLRLSSAPEARLSRRPPSPRPTSHSSPLRYSREYLEGLAGETAFQPELLEKVLRLERVLDQVGRYPYLQWR